MKFYLKNKNQKKIKAQLWKLLWDRAWEVKFFFKLYSLITQSALKELRKICTVHKKTCKKMFNRIVEIENSLNTYTGWKERWINGIFDQRSTV